MGLRYVSERRYCFHENFPRFVQGSVRVPLHRTRKHHFWKHVFRLEMSATSTRSSMMDLPKHIMVNMQERHFFEDLIIF